MNIIDFRLAHERIRPYVKRTPLERSETLSCHLGTNVYVKFELFQKTGSFKPRGAFNKLLSLAEDERKRGVVAVSGGNHAQAVAYVAKELGIDAVIAMPENTPLNYLDATRRYGATVDLQPNIAAAFDKANQYENEGRIFVHPFDDDNFIAGHGTMGLEILEDAPDTTAVIAGIGGGGLITGVGSAIKALKPQIKVWGAEPETAAPAALSFKMGSPQVFKDWKLSFVDGAGGQSVFPRMWERMKPVVDGYLVVSLEETKNAMRLMAEKSRIIAEGAGALSLAAALTGKAGQGPIVAVVSGGNIDLKKFCELVTGT